VDVKAPLQDSAVPEDVKAFESLVVEGLGEKGAGVSLRQEETRAV
jgi:formylmethanofuran:tetrahydromethanopterin formyltransferase